jgi:predicted metal-binding membrane protein
MVKKTLGTSLGPIERLVRHDRGIVILAASLIVLLAGIYTYFGGGMQMTGLEMTRMAQAIGEPMSMGAQPVWTGKYVILIFFMWWIMMIAMMVPSAAPMLLLYTALKRMGPEGNRAVSLSFLFLLGYLAIWAVFSAIATGLQFGAESFGLLSGQMMAVNSRIFAAIVFIAAGLYQLSSLKDSCLRHCKSPAYFLAEHSRPGSWGAFSTGAQHGVYCLGCCWALMTLLFVGGIMNLYWIVGISIYVLVEKVFPYSRFFISSTGVGLILFGGYLLVTSWG